MVRGVFVLAVFHLFGEALAKGLRLPVPGPVLGMIALIVSVLGLGMSGRLEGVVAAGL